MTEEERRILIKAIWRDIEDDSENREHALGLMVVLKGCGYRADRCMVRLLRTAADNLERGLDALEIRH